MFLKKIIKKDRNGNPKYVHYRLCESYRIGNRVRHRAIHNLGELGGPGQYQRKLLADRIEDLLSGDKLLLFSNIDSEIEKKAQFFADLIIKRQAVAIQPTSVGETIPEKEKDFARVDLDSIENKDVQEIGAEWITKQTMDGLDIAGLLSSLGFNKREIDLSYVGWISRTVNPMSELATEQWLRRNTGLCELMGIKAQKINRHHLYFISRKLHKNKDKIDNYFTAKTRELFNLDDTIIIYDLTNSYFEGRMLGSRKAKHGLSKEKRNDCKIIVLALVVSKEGFIRYSKIYRGNMSDCKTLATTIEELELNANPSSKPTVVIDAGIATEENLGMLKSKQYQYVSISRTALKDFDFGNNAPYTVYDNKGQAIELVKTNQDKNDDLYLYVKSPSKQLKEVSIKEKLSCRFEEGLGAIKESLTKKRGVKTVEKVYERIGRLKAKYPRVSGNYGIATKQGGGKVYEISWKAKQEEKPGEEGIYFIRTNYSKQAQEQLIWDIYNCIREIESTFRCLKTELCIRPNFHQKDENIEGHIHLGLLAYHIVSIIRYKLKQAGINDSWKTLISKMNTQKIMTTSFFDEANNKIHIRNCSTPNAELREIQKILKSKPVPFYRKKVVVPQQ
jgi:transposase